MQIISQLWPTKGDKNDQHSQPIGGRPSESSTRRAPANAQTSTNAEEAFDGSMIFNERMEENFQKLMKMRYGHKGANEYPPVPRASSTSLFKQFLTYYGLLGGMGGNTPLLNPQGAEAMPPVASLAGNPPSQTTALPALSETESSIDTVNAQLDQGRLQLVKPEINDVSLPRSKRAVIEVAPLHGNLPVCPSSLVAARIQAARELMGSAADGKDDEEVLDAANRIHVQAQRHPDRIFTEEVSKKLLVKEAQIWADQNGNKELQLPLEKIIEIYNEAWELALEPPSPPKFKSRDEIQAELDSNKINSGSGPISKFINDNIVSDNYHASVKKYYEQFSDFISSNLPKFVTLKALENAAVAGLGRIHMEYRPNRVWTVSDVLLDRLIAAVRRHPQSLMRGQQIPAYFFSMPDGRFGMVGPQGEFKFLSRNALDEHGKLKKEVVLRALGIAFAEDIKGSFKVGCSGDSKNCPSANFQIVQSRSDTGDDALSIKEMMELKIRNIAISSLNKIKEESYNIGTAEVLFRLLPFYEEITKSNLDPNHEFSFSNIAWDVADLAATFIFIGLAGAKAGYKGLKAAAPLLRSAATAGSTRKVSIILRALIDSYKTSSFLRLAGKELTDFILPVFSTKSLVQSASQGAKRVVQKALTHSIAKTEKSIMAAIRRAKPAPKLHAETLRALRTDRFTIEDATRLVGKNPNSHYVDDKKGFIYKGFVFRGDMRAPEEIFGQGFKLRTEIKDIEEVNGFRGGFGGGKDALDIDGRGISTSPFAMTKDHAGADVYGRARGGYTYLVDARELEGYDLYKNAAFARFRNTYKKSTDDAAKHAALSHPRPMEINYGTDIPAEKIIGAFDRNGKYLPNPGYRATEVESLPKVVSLATSAWKGARLVSRIKELASSVEQPGPLEDEAHYIAPAAIANLLKRRIEIRDFPKSGRKWHVDPSDGTEKSTITIAHSSGHYDAYINDELVRMPEDENSLFRAISAALNKRADIPDVAVEILREKTAEELRNHAERYVDQLKAHHEARSTRHYHVGRKTRHERDVETEPAADPSL